MNKIKSIWGIIIAMAFCATACQQDDLMEQIDTTPTGEYVNFNIQRGWDFDQISRSANTEYGDYFSSHELTSEDQSEAIKVQVYQRPMGEVESRGTMVQKATFNAFTAYAYKTTNTTTGGTTTYSTESWFTSSHLKTNGSWNTKPTGEGTNANGYYWPGAGVACSFYGLAMSDDKLSTVMTNNMVFNKNAKNQINSITYTVPAAAADQPDIMFAADIDVDGSGSVNPTLDFKHILSAVNVKVGVKDGETTMPEGTIQSITFKNVYGKGIYNIESKSWSGMREANDIRNFSVNLGSGFNTDDINQTTPVTTGTATFMMIPQTLRSDAEIEVVFKHKIGTTSTISASLSGMSWTMGTEINYLISISPEGELKFSSTIPVVDAHYVIVPFKITNSISTSNKTWRLTAYNSNGEDVGIYLRTELSTLQSQGYWTYNEFTSEDGKEISRSTTKEVQVYAFIPENNSTENRNIRLSLYAGSSTTAAATMNFTQLGMNSAYSERIEETGYVPWGFSWDSNTTIVYKIKAGDGRRILMTLYEWFVDGNTDLMDVSWGWSDATVTIKLKNISTSNLGVSDEVTGLANTKTIYNYQGISNLVDFKSTLDNWKEAGNASIESGEWPENPDEFAARTCAMKNKFKKETKNQSSITGSESIDYATLEESNFVWYLPASGEYAAIETVETSGSYKLEGDYWTSTAPENNSSQAFKYTSGIGASLENRTVNNKVRCKRVN